MQEFEMGVSLEMYLFPRKLQIEVREVTSCLVCVIPVFRTLSRYLSTSPTGSTGGLHEIKITFKRLDGIVSR